MKVFIRADASVNMGTGHIMRCLVLAEEIRNRGGDVTFICRLHEGHLCDYLEKKRKFTVVRLQPDNNSYSSQKDSSDDLYDDWLGADWQTDAKESRDIITGQKADWLLVDHYTLDIRWENFLRPFVQQVMVIDDLANRSHDCDVLLDQNLSFENQRYNRLVPSACCLMLGPEYALLRPEFARQRTLMKSSVSEVERVIVFFGGSERSNETMKILEVIQGLNLSKIVVDVVLGNAGSNRSQIEKFASGFPYMNVHYQVDNMAELMGNADLFVGAGGSITWERCCLGIPSLVMTIAENQRQLTSAASQEGVLVDLGKASGVTKRILQKKILEIIENHDLRQAMSIAGRRLVDGKGIIRVLKKGMGEEAVVSNPEGGLL